MELLKLRRFFCGSVYFHLLVRFIVPYANVFKLDWVKILSFELTLSQTSPGFLRVCSTSLLKTKTLWGKKKLPVTSNFSFSHSVFYPFG